MDFDPFLNNLKTNRNCSAETIKAYRSDLKMFETFLHGRSISRLSQINHLVIKGYIEDMQKKVNLRSARIGLAESSIARRLAAISSYFEFVRANSDQELRNPLKEVLRKWQKNNRPKPVDDMTLEFLITGMTNLRDRTLFTLFLASGLRVSEMHRLNRDSIRMDADEVGPEDYPPEDDHLCGCGEVVGKGNKLRKFYVDARTLYLYAEYLVTRTDQNPALFLSERKQRMSVRAIQYTLATWCARLGAPHINVHRLRHSYATRLANADIPSMVLKDLMGHSSLTTTLGYFKLNDKTLARGYFSAMERVNR
jgi:site-specific recombinase XerD